MSMSELISIIWARRALVCALLVGIVGLTIAVNAVRREKFTATGAVIVDTRPNDPAAQATATPSMSSYLATQTDVIESHTVAAKVVDALSLTKDSMFIERFAVQPHHAGTLLNFIADELLKKLGVISARDSNVLSIYYTDTDPTRAAQVVNAFADAYIQTSLELKVDAAKRQAVWFERQVTELRDKLAFAQHRLSDFQRSSEIFGMEDVRLDVENSRVQEISNHLVAAQAAMYSAMSTQQRLTSGELRERPDELPDILKDPLLQNLKTELARAEARMADVDGHYGHEHPMYRSAAAEVAALQNKVDAQIATAKASIDQAAAIARQQVEELQRSLDKQKARILALTRQRDQYTVLNRDVESARGAYDAALEHTTSSQLESRRDQTNIAVLTPAIAPVKPSSPRWVLNIALSVVLGFMLACATAVAAERQRPRIRSAHRLRNAVRVPVLAELPALNRAARKSLVTAMAVSAPPRGGL
jgi:chain length determinant protein EpsF